MAASNFLLVLLLLDTSGVKELQFVGNPETQTVTIPISELEEKSGAKTASSAKKLVKENFEIEFSPSKMVIVKSEQDKTEVSAGTCTKESTENCLQAGTAIHHINVKSDMPSEQVVITLNGADSKSLQATFVKCSAAIWMSRLFVVIFASLAAFFFLN
ncbi:unnamed protein product [Schistocephalus solidus]|uniref:SAG-related sequence SRS53C n=1 Tax=Schistocephalus solidus TaxID=70667 RepID=A0A183SEG5_SCHSO|nr:unnamed protein product [Schistocephalus solidus]